MLTLVVAMTAGCRAVLLAATAFWLAGRRLLKACIYRNGVLVFRQEGTSDRPLPAWAEWAGKFVPSVRFAPFWTAHQASQSAVSFN